MRTKLTLSFLILAAVLTTHSCRNGNPEPAETPESTQVALQTAVVAALDSLVADIVAERPADTAEYTERLQAYLEAHPTFYGGAVALLDESGTVTSCPYVYRTEDGYEILDLALPSYEIESQDWFKMPLDANEGIWTAPYFDAGGGETWMITRSVPVRDDEMIFAVVTTDLPVDPPGKE